MLVSPCGSTDDMMPLFYAYTITFSDEEAIIISEVFVQNVYPRVCYDFLWSFCFRWIC